jgi:protein MAK16
MVTVNHTLEKRERNRERKAMAAAKLEKSLEQELVSRLKSKAYGDAPLNVNEEVWAKVLEADRKALGGEELMDEETDEEDEDELEREFVSDIEESDEDEWADRADVSEEIYASVYSTGLTRIRLQIDLSDLDEEDLSGEGSDGAEGSESDESEGEDGPKRKPKRGAPQPPSRPERKKPRSRCFLFIFPYFLRADSFLLEGPRRVEVEYEHELEGRQLVRA